MGSLFTLLEITWDFGISSVVGYKQCILVHEAYHSKFTVVDNCCSMNVGGCPKLLKQRLANWSRLKLH